MRPRGPQDEAKMGSRRAPWRRLGGLGPLGALLGRSWVVLGGALGPLLGPPGASLGLIWASRGLLLEPFGLLWKAP